MHLVGSALLHDAENGRQALDTLRALTQNTTVTIDYRTAPAAALRWNVVLALDGFTAVALEPATCAQA